MKTKNFIARCLEPNSDVPYVLHEVRYQYESPIKDNLWINTLHTLYATDPIDAINKAKEKLIP